MATETQYQMHSRHSRLVREWRAKEVLSYASDEIMDLKERAGYVLRSPAEGHVVQVSFCCYEGRDDIVRVRSTNWAAEYEPNGVYSKTDARAFYKALLKAGFVKREG